MSQRKPVLLITGFGPFPGVPINPSSLLASQLGVMAKSSFPDAQVEVASLPTRWRGAPQELERLLDLHRPDIVLHFGVSDKARGFVIETMARNEACNAADEEGALPPLDCLEERAPASLQVNIDTDLLEARLRARTLPVVKSSNAGNYICNAVLFYSLSRGLQKNNAMLAGFIHIPDRLQPEECGAGAGEHRAARKAQPSALNWADAIAGGLEIVAGCLEQLPSTTPAQSARR